MARFRGLTIRVAGPPYSLTMATPPTPGPPTQPTCPHRHLMGPKWAAFWVPNGLPHIGPIWICPGASIGQPTWAAHMGPKVAPNVCYLIMPAWVPHAAHMVFKTNPTDCFQPQSEREF